MSIDILSPLLAAPPFRLAAPATGPLLVVAAAEAASPWLDLAAGEAPWAAAADARAPYVDAAQADG